MRSRYFRREGALKGEEFDRSEIPEQTKALAAIYWPLSVSTNYDHLFYCSCRETFEDRLPPMVLGRGAEDCKQVMSALVSPFDREIIWHIQVNRIRCRSEIKDPLSKGVAVGAWATVNASKPRCGSLKAASTIFCSVVI